MLCARYSRDSSELGCLSTISPSRINGTVSIFHLTESKLSAQIPETALPTVKHFELFKANVAGVHGRFIAGQRQAFPWQGLDAVRQVLAGFIKAWLLVDNFPVPNQWHRQHLGAQVTGIRLLAIEREDDLFDSNARGAVGAQGALGPADGLFRFRALCDGMPIDFHDFVHHARGWRARTGDYGSTHTVDIHWVTAQASYCKFIQVRGNHNLGVVRT